MGNGSSMKKSQRPKPRVVLESPQSSIIDNTQPKVTFANKRTGTDLIKARPKMTDIGTIHSDVISGGRVRFQRSQLSRLESSLSMNNSFTSIRSTASGPVDGVWEPTLNPYEQTNNTRMQNGEHNLNENSYDRYVGFRERDYRYGTRVENGLATVDEI